MTLDELITALEAADPAQVVLYGFTNPHSWRGRYEELAFEPARDVTVGQMLADARDALDVTYQGWKGGDYTMHGWTTVHVAQEGEWRDDDLLTPLVVAVMLADHATLPNTVVEALRLTLGATTADGPR